MRKTLVAAVAALSLIAGAGAATAASGPHDPRDDNPNNDHGRCTAFFNGQKKGHETPTDEVLQEIFDSCEGNIGGNPEENGRFADCFNDSDNDPNTDSCSDGDA